MESDLEGVFEQQASPIFEIDPEVTHPIGPAGLDNSGSDEIERLQQVFQHGRRVTILPGAWALGYHGGHSILGSLPTPQSQGWEKGTENADGAVLVLYRDVPAGCMVRSNSREATSPGR
jgi:hypothetical protein